MNMTTLNIDDMHCATCVGKIQTGLDQLEGIVRLRFNPARRQVVISHESSLATHELLRQVEHIGFHPYITGFDGLSSSPSRESSDQLLKRLGVAGLAMMQVMMVAIALYSGADEYRRILEFTGLLFCIPVVSYSAMPFFTAALRSVRGGLSMDVPIALAIFIAFTSSVYSTLEGYGEVYYDSVVMFTFLLLLARYIDLNLKYQMDAQDALMCSLPQHVTRLGTQGRETCALEEIQIGDTVWVGEGGQIPVDGVLLSDSAYIDEALLTGEDTQRVRRKDDVLYAGTFNRGAGISVLVRAISEQTRMATINKLAGETLMGKNSVARLADRIAGIFIPSVLLMSISTYAIWSFVEPERAFSAGLAVLVISCPCALSLAIPAALSAAMLRLRHAGVVLKDGKYLELLPSVTELFMDKTGTLTQPDQGIAGMKVFTEYDALWCVSVAGALQSFSSHPLAKCFVNSDLELSGVKTVPGSGVQAIYQGDCVRVGSADFCGHDTDITGEIAGNKSGLMDKSVYLGVNGIAVACFYIENPLRAHAAEAVEALGNSGLDVHMVSGDLQENCEVVAKTLNLDFDAQQSPEDKWKLINQRMDKTHVLMFVGDGINDLPSLAGADVSVAMLEANDLVKSRADIVLLTTRLGALVDLFTIARKTRFITRQNLAWAFSYNLIAIPAAALGYTPPWMAALGMALSSTLVMLNATRLMRVPLAREGF